MVLYRLISFQHSTTYCLFVVLFAINMICLHWRRNLKLEVSLTALCFCALTAIINLSAFCINLGYIWNVHWVIQLQCWRQLYYIIFINLTQHLLLPSVTLGNCTMTMIAGLKWHETYGHPIETTCICLHYPIQAKRIWNSLLLSDCHWQ